MSLNWRVRSHLCRQLGAPLDLSIEQRVVFHKINTALLTTQELIPLELREKLTQAYQSTAQTHQLRTRRFFSKTLRRKQYSNRAFLMCDNISKFQTVPLRSCLKPLLEMCKIEIVTHGSK